VAGGEPFLGQEMIPVLVKRKDTAEDDLNAGLSPRDFEVFRLRAAPSCESVPCARDGCLPGHR
jgi:hypothetical protein